MNNYSWYHKPTKLWVYFLPNYKSRQIISLALENDATVFAQTEIPEFTNFLKSCSFNGVERYAEDNFLEFELKKTMKTKYKIEIIEGCTAFDTLINEISIVEIPKEEQEKIADYLIDKLKESYRTGETTLENLIQNFQYDDYEHDPNPCGQCGDTVSTTTYNI
jgi:hypothetical protein